MAKGIQNSSNNYLLVLVFDIAVGYFCMYIAALLKFNLLKQKNQALENALTEKQQENVATLLKHQNEKQEALMQELEWLTAKIKVFTERRAKSDSGQCLYICRTQFDSGSINNHSAQRHM